MKAKLIITNDLTLPFSYGTLLRKILNQTLALQKITLKTEVSLEVVDSIKMAKVCKEYELSKPVTDVLAFPADWKALAPLIGFNLLGDIIICHEKVLAQAKAYNHSRQREWAYLFAHGLFHLLGYDHLSKKDEQEMHGQIEAILQNLGVKR